MQCEMLHYLSVFTPILNLIIVVASNFSGLNELTTYYGCISLFCHLKMCVSCGLLVEFKGLVMSGRWVGLSRETWPLIMKFDVLEMLLSECKFWCSSPRGCIDSEKKFWINGTKRMISHEYSAWHLLSQTQPHWTLTPLFKGLFMVPALCAFLYRGISPFFTEPPAVQAALNRSVVWKLYCLYPQQGHFLRIKGSTEIISRY